MERYLQMFEVAGRTHTDKGLCGPSHRWSGNNYVDIYQAYLGHLRLQPIRILEIGLGVRGDRWNAQVAHGDNEGGASIKLWSDFFPNAQIVGIDINEASFLNTDRITTYVLDQGDREALTGWAASQPPFDVIVDDGSHRGDHQQISLEALFPAVRPGGIYFIEDLNGFGAGGRSGGRHSSDVVPTRNFLWEYAQSGRTIEPNAFSDTSFLDGISAINFHAPVPRLRPRDLVIEAARTLAGRGAWGISRREFAPKTHTLVALRKKEDGASA